jgi:hypothetical protein
MALNTTPFVLRGFFVGLKPALHHNGGSRRNDKNNDKKQMRGFFAPLRMIAHSCLLSKTTTLVADLGEEALPVFLVSAVGLF